MITASQLNDLRTGIDQALKRLQIQLNEEVLSEALPLVGDNVADVARAALNNNTTSPAAFLDSARAKLVGELARFNGPNGASAADVEQALKASGLPVMVSQVGSDVKVSLLFDIGRSAGRELFNVPAASGLGVPELGSTINAGAGEVVAAGINFGYALDLGLDATGFYLEVPTSQNRPDLRLDAFFSTEISPGASLDLDFRLVSGDLTARASGLIDVDFLPQGRVRLDALSAPGNGAVLDLFSASISNVSFEGTLTPQVLPGAAVVGASGPPLQASLRLDYGSGSMVVDPGTPGLARLPDLVFGLSVDPAALVRGNLFKTVQDIAAPLGKFREAIDLLTQPNDFLRKLGVSQTRLIDFLGVPEGVKTAATQLGGLFRFTDQVFAHDAPMLPRVDFADVRIKLPGAGGSGMGFQYATAPVDPSATPADQAVILRASRGLEGLSLPFLNDQTALPRFLLTGEHIDLVRYVSPRLELSHSVGLDIPVTPAITARVMAALGVSAQITAGLDTLGFANLQTNPITGIARGLYLQRLATPDSPATEISAGLTASLGVAAGLPFARVGIDGEISGALVAQLSEQADRADGATDGRVRLGQITNLTDLLDIGGRITAGAEIYLEAGFGPASIDLTVVDIPEITLADFGLDASPSPVLAELGSEATQGVVFLNVGPRSANRLHGLLADFGEQITVDRSSLGGLLVTFVGPVPAAQRLNVDPGTLQRIQAQGGAAADVLRVANVTVPVQFAGGEGADTLIGAQGPDLLEGDALGDELRGDAGNDTLRGGSGADRLNGDADADQLFGDADSDDLRGGDGDDLLAGDDGDDDLSGNAGRDTLRGGNGIDRALYTDAPARVVINLQTGQHQGEPANDVLESIERYRLSPHNDAFIGSNDPAIVDDAHGDAGDDSLEGFAGVDLLDGGDGADTLRGGADNDILIGSAGPDLLDGGDGFDAVTYLTATRAITLDLTQPGTGTNDAQGDVLQGIEVVIGTHQDPGDVLLGDAGDTLFEGFGGSDSIDGGAGNDRIFGDIGRVLLSDDRAASFFGSPQRFDDALRGGAGRDLLFGQLGADTLFGDADGDLLDGGIGNDVLDGGEGNDTLLGDGADDTLGGSKDDHLFDFDAVGVDHLDGNQGSNRLSADIRHHRELQVNFVAGANNTFAFANGERYQNIQRLGHFISGPLNDRIDLGNGQDESFRHTIDGHLGDDLIIGASDAPPPLTSGKNVETLLGGAGNDWINPGFYSAGIEFAFEVGNFIPSNSPNFPHDLLDGGDGIDTLDLSRLRSNAPTMSFSDAAQILGIGASEPAGAFIDLQNNLSSGRTASGSAGLRISGFENVVGTVGSDDLKGTSDANIFYPLTRGVLLLGSVGLSGHDFVDGRDGVDRVVLDYSTQGGVHPLGLDFVRGGAKLPQRLLVSGGSVDGIFAGRLNTSDPAELRVFLLSATAVEQLHLVATNGDDRIFWSVGHDDAIDARGGDDVIRGRGGRDTLLGGDGNDTFIQHPLTREFSTTGQDALDNFNHDVSIDGGNGFDSVSIAAPHINNALIWNDMAPQEVQIGTGYLRNIERLLDVTSGSGADAISQSGRINNTINTGAGNDTVRAGLGVDRIDTGDGDDLVEVDFSIGDSDDLTGIVRDSFFGRRSKAAPNTEVDGVSIVNAERVLIRATEKDDEFDNGANLVSLSSDSLYGLGGNDTIRSGAGNDLLDGGDGNDVLFAGLGDDTLDGGRGNDRLEGGSDQGRDLYRVRTGDGHDTVEGSLGDDELALLGRNVADVLAVERIDRDDLLLRLNGGDTVRVTRYFENIALRSPTTDLPLDRIRFADNTVWSDPEIAARVIALATPAGGGLAGYTEFANRIRGAGGADSLFGGNLGDVLEGGAGNDALDGRAGQDTLDGGAGNDTLEGGADVDTYRFRAGDGIDLIREFVGFNPTAQNRVELLDINFTSLRGLERSKGALFILYGTTDELQIPAAVATIQTFVFADRTLSGTELFGLARVRTTEGNDLVDESLGDILVDGRGGNDSIRTGDGLDTLLGGAGDDTLDGGAGSDLLDGGIGQDTLIGGLGGDTYVFRRGDGIDLVRDVSSGLRDSLPDTAEFPDTQIRDISVFRDAQQGVLTVRYGVADEVRIFAADGADAEAGAIETFRFADGTLTAEQLLGLVETLGTEGNDNLSLLEGSVRVNGRGGNDRITTGAGRDSVLGGLGLDTLNGGAGDDRLDGGPDNDQIEGGEGADTVFGGDGADLLFGRNGNDVIDPGRGNDTVFGNLGNDRYIYRRVDGRDELEELVFSDGSFISGGLDTLQFPDIMASQVVALRRLSSGGQNGNDLLIDLGSGDSVLLRNYFADIGKEIEALVFADGTRWGRAEIFARADGFTGTAGADQLVGTGLGGVLLQGLDGNDTLTGLFGSDTLDGGPGSDTLDGLFGADVYVFRRGDGVDVVRASRISPVPATDRDVARLLDRTPGDVVDLRFEGASLVLDLEGGDRVTFEEFATSFGTVIQRLEFANGTAWNRDTLISLTGAFADAVPAVRVTPTGLGGVVQGSFRNDSITVSTLASALDSAQADVLRRGSVRIEPGAGDDLVTGFEGNEVVRASRGADTISGGDGDDTLLVQLPAIHQGTLSVRTRDDGVREVVLQPSAGPAQVLFTLQVSTASNPDANGPIFETLLFTASPNGPLAHLGTERLDGIEQILVQRAAANGNPATALRLEGLASVAPETISGIGLRVQRVIGTARSEFIVFDATADAMAQNVPIDAFSVFVDPGAGNDFVAVRAGQAMVSASAGADMIQGDVLEGGSLGAARLPTTLVVDVPDSATATGLLTRRAEGVGRITVLLDMEPILELFRTGDISWLARGFGVLEGIETEQLAGVGAVELRRGGQPALRVDLDLSRLELSFPTEGDDFKEGLFGPDFVVGGAGNDTLLGGAGNDALDGDNGDDLLFGGDGNDALDGGDGDDLLFGGDDADRFRLGAGADVAHVAPGDTGFVRGDAASDYATPVDVSRLDVFMDFAVGDRLHFGTVPSDPSTRVFSDDAGGSGDTISGPGVARISGFFDAFEGRFATAMNPDVPGFFGAPAVLLVYHSDRETGPILEGVVLVGVDAARLTLNTADGSLGLTT